MKILLATESYYPNIDGGAIAQYNLVNELNKRGHEIIVITPGTSKRNKVEKIQGVTVYRTRAVRLPLYMNGRYHFSPFPLFKIGKIIKKFKPDIVHVCSPYPVSVSAMFWARKHDIPVMGSIHVLPQNMIAPFFRLKNYDIFEKYSWSYLVYFFNLVDWATIPTQTGANMYIEKGLKKNITSISNGLKTEVFNPNNDGEYLRKKFNLPKKNIVICTGRMNEEKNLDVLIKAIPCVREKIDAHFLFVGSGGDYIQWLKDLAEELKVLDHTTFTDFLDWDDYPNIYSIADVFALPAESELQSIVTMEAVASGLPVVVVNKGALPELASNDNGLIFEPQNSKQLADCLIKILSDDKLKEKMGKKSLDLIKKHSMESVAVQYEKAFENTIKNPRYLSLKPISVFSPNVH
jgi:glycosyltransferase involved in cell wall biosynthesis